MNRLVRDRVRTAVRVAVVASLAGPVLAWSSSAFAQATAAPSAAPAASEPAIAPVPAAARGSVAPSGFRPQIETFIKGNVGRLSSKDAKTFLAARDALVGEVAASGSTPAYRDFYAEVFAATALPVLDSPDARLRLALGVVSARLADRTGSVQLGPVAAKLLKDANLGVQIWGMKTAEGVLKAQLVSGSGGPGGGGGGAGIVAGGPVEALVTAVVDTVTKNPTKAELVRDAAEALHLDIRFRMSDAVLKEVVPFARKVLAARAALYQPAAVPQDPAADQPYLTFFSNKAWRVLTADEQTATVQSITTMLLSTTGTAKPLTGEAYMALARHAVQVARNLEVIASAVNTSAGTPESKNLLNVTQQVSRIASSLPTGAVLDTRANDVLSAVQGVSQFSGLTAFPAAQGAAGTQPAGSAGK